MKYRRLLFISILLLTAAVSCTGTPVATPSGPMAAGQTEARPTASSTSEHDPNRVLRMVESGTPYWRWDDGQSCCWYPGTDPTLPTATHTPWITWTPAPRPDVELAQLQTNRSQFFAEIINHLNVPVVFEDQKPAFRFDVYDPLLDEHFQGEEMINRYNDLASVPCVIYPGETAFFYGGHDALAVWDFIDNTSPYQSLQITYQSLGVPRPDWKENGTHYEIRDLTWRVDGNVMYFSFRHNPLHVVYGGGEYFIGSMGLYDKDNHLLGVAYGWPITSIDTGIADNFWVSLDGTAQGVTRGGWAMVGVKDVKERFDHIKIMLEVLPEIDGVCRVRLPTPTR